MSTKGFDSLSAADMVRVDLEGCDPIYVREILLGDDVAIGNASSKSAAIVAVSCVDEQGKRIWTYEQATKLRKKRVAKILDAFYNINGLNEVSIQEAEKN